MFLYARKMNESKALDLIRNYYKFREEHDLWFRHLEPYDPKIQMAIQDGFPSVLPNLDRLIINIFSILNLFYYFVNNICIYVFWCV